MSNRAGPGRWPGLTRSKSGPGLSARYRRAVPTQGAWTLLGRPAASPPGPHHPCRVIGAGHRTSPVIFSSIEAKADYVSMPAFLRFRPGRPPLALRSPLLRYRLQQPCLPPARLAHFGSRASTSSSSAAKNSCMRSSHPSRPPSKYVRSTFARDVAASMRCALTTTKSCPQRSRGGDRQPRTHTRREPGAARNIGDGAYLVPRLARRLEEQLGRRQQRGQLGHATAHGGGDLVCEGVSGVRPETSRCVKESAGARNGRLPWSISSTPCQTSSPIRSSLIQ